MADALKGRLAFGDYLLQEIHDPARGFRSRRGPPSSRCGTAVVHLGRQLRVNRDPCGPRLHASECPQPPQNRTFLKAVGRQVVSDPMSIHAARPQRRRHVDDTAAAHIIEAAQLDELAAQLRGRAGDEQRRRWRHGPRACRGRGNAGGRACLFPPATGRR